MLVTSIEFSPYCSLSSMGFSGTLSPAIGVLKSLSTLSAAICDMYCLCSSCRTLILSRNNLSGKIPDSISNLPSLINLKQIKLWHKLFKPCASDANETGKLPSTCCLVFLNSDNFLPIFIGSSHKSKRGVIIGVVGGIVLLLLGVALFLVCKGKHKGYKREIFVDVAGEVDRRIAFGQLKRFAWRELQLATDNFSEKNVLGQGGFGKVYKGVLPDNTKIAVKRLADYGAPVGNKLSYNLSVAYRLREFKPEEPVLDWATRKRVAFGTARGLEYLHEHCNPKIIHRDVKAANVLMDEDFEAVVGDFGLAKLVDVRRTNVTTQVRGTIGHIAPEYLSTGKSSERTDVFGYGIMLLELVTGQRAIDFSLLEEEDDVLLLDHVKKLQREKRLHAIVDSNLNGNFNSQEVEMMIKVALLCTQPSPEERPTMSVVVRMLEGEGLAERWEEWQQVEITRRQEYERFQRRFDWGEDSIYNQDAIELSGGR
ncbi:hypothetical protein Sjap_022078 [Stephania japonica]|uniref:non-specific serine/threonine protein kinase n=1 Tax=Stephania japonica TaxID=461633 RepID=A0AAP0ENN0_9MAGN